MMKKPNLVYIFADQWRRTAVGFSGEEAVITPNIDQFAAQASVFEQAVSCTPICSPHRASLMTGKYSYSTGVYTNCKLGLPIGLPEDEITISDVLKQNGYHTAYIGKWHLDCAEQNVEEYPASGARDWDAYTPPGPKRHSFDHWYSYGTYDEHLTPHYWQDNEQMININEWSVKHETDQAIQYLQSRQGQDDSFALFLSWNPPHSPFDLVPQQYKEIYADKEITALPNVKITDHFLVHTGELLPGGYETWQQSVRDYYAAITGIDEQFGRILHALDELGYSDNTVVVLTADHGELLGAHGMMAKHSWHEESIGVPFVVRLPEQRQPQRIPYVLNTVDIFPTLLELLNINRSDALQMDGQSLAAVVKNEDVDTEALGARLAFISAYPGSLKAIQQFTEQGLNNLEYGWRGIRSLNYTYVIHKGYFPGQETKKLLYDLREDPYQLSPKEITNVEESTIAAKLEQHLLEILSSIGDPFDIN